MIRHVCSHLVTSVLTSSAKLKNHLHENNHRKSVCEGNEIFVFNEYCDIRNLLRDIFLTNSCRNGKVPCGAISCAVTDFVFWNRHPA